MMISSMNRNLSNTRNNIRIDKFSALLSVVYEGNIITMTL